MTINAIYVVQNPYTAYVMSNKHLFEKIVVTLQLSVAKLKLAIPMFLMSLILPYHQTFKNDRKFFIQTAVH